MAETKRSREKDNNAGSWKRRKKTRKNFRTKEGKTDGRDIRRNQERKKGRKGRVI